MKLNSSRYLIAVFFAGFAATAFGQTRSWVSGVGNDANPCSRTAPCKTFAGAISKTSTGGEISVLDPGGFGAVTIGKGITLNGTGTLAGILNSLGVNGVVVNAPATDTIIIRDISINGAGTGGNGIRYLAGKTLMVDHCWIYGQNNAATSRGIDVSKSAAGNLKVLPLTGRTIVFAEVMSSSIPVAGVQYLMLVIAAIALAFLPVYYGVGLQRGKWAGGKVHSGIRVDRGLIREITTFGATLFPAFGLPPAIR